MKMVMNMMILIIMLVLCTTIQGQLRVGFYSNSCPDAEVVVGDLVRDAAKADTQMAARLLRLHFHDCFVEGCDASIMVDDSPTSERSAVPHQGVGGFEVIENAKGRLEKLCPGVVSCADIIALAARDAIVARNGPIYEVETGRRDGLISDEALADNMPDVNDSIMLLKAKFHEKGLTEKDLAVLSGAHTIGTTACFFMGHRLYGFVPAGGSDPSINPAFLPELKATCPLNGDVNVRLPMDHGGGGEMFDKHVFDNIRRGFAVLQSDAALYEDPATKNVVDSYFGSSSGGPSFEADFARAIVKLGRVGVKMGSQGGVRRVCSSLK